MTKIFSIALLAAFGLAAQAPAAKASTKASTKASPAAAKKTASAPQPLVIPKDAVAKPDGTYAWTDAQGKSWIFSHTPFGVIKTENPSTSAVSSNALTGVKTFDEGDKVRFESMTPFGLVKHEKNKKDLTDEERSLFNSQNPSQNAKQD